MDTIIDVSISQKYRTTLDISSVKGFNAELVTKLLEKLGEPKSTVLYPSIQSWHHSCPEAQPCHYSDGGYVPAVIADEWEPGSHTPTPTEETM